MEKIYDVLIIGGGAAGMTAAVYAKRRGKNVAILERYALGGQVVTLNRIENFPSQKEIDGFSLSQQFASQIKHLEIPVLFDEVQSVDFSGEIKDIMGRKQSYLAKSVIIATGMASVEIGKNENQFLGRGVSYCAVCDANFFKNQEVCVASRKGSGIAGALELSGVCSKVTVLDSEDMTKFASHNKNKKLEIVSNVQITGVKGEEKLNSIHALVDGKEKNFTTSGLFVELGKIPATKLFEGQLKLDDKGFIVTDGKMKTSAEGVFAVGDVRSGFLKQIVTACSDGAIAGQLA